MSNCARPDRHRRALVLPGGGARGAYQVGVLREIARMCRERGSSTDFIGGNPFPIISGTSAGAINALVLASHAHEYGVGVERLEHFWARMRCHHIYHTDLPTTLGTAMRWSGAITLGRFGVRPPRSLLDNQPLRELLNKEVQWQGVKQGIDSRALDAVAVTVSGYRSASAISYFQGRSDLAAWHRPRRVGIPGRLNVEHLMGSAALPVLFPAAFVENQYVGDGALRQTAPLSPAIHLGADKILIIGTRDNRPDNPARDTEQQEYPSLGEIAGYMLDTLFMDNLHADLARLERINRTLELLDANECGRTPLKRIDTLLIKPSEDMRSIAARHVHRVPRSVQYLLGKVGVWGGSMRVPSYLLFESEFCTELMDLGEADAVANQDAIEEFLS